MISVMTLHKLKLAYWAGPDRYVQVGWECNLIRHSPVADIANSCLLTEAMLPVFWSNNLIPPIQDLDNRFPCIGCCCCHQSF